MVTYLHIHAISDKASVGRLHFGQVTFPCVIGRHGRAHLKREGDGTSPIGHWMLDKGYYRADRVRRPSKNFPMNCLKKSDGWCDDPLSLHYNQHVLIPQHRSHESMWREDGAYDVVFSTNHNTRPRIRGAGSAIFLHLTRSSAPFTAGCVAVSTSDMVKILARCGRRICLIIGPSQGQLTRRLKTARQISHYRPSRE